MILYVSLVLTVPSAPFLDHFKSINTLKYIYIYV